MSPLLCFIQPLSVAMIWGFDASFRMTIHSHKTSISSYTMLLPLTSGLCDGSFRICMKYSKSCKSVYCMFVFYTDFATWIRNSTGRKPQITGQQPFFYICTLFGYFEEKKNLNPLKIKLMARLRGMLRFTNKPVFNVIIIWTVLKPVVWIKKRHQVKKCFNEFTFLNMLWYENQYHPA